MWLFDVLYTGTRSLTKNLPFYTVRPSNSSVIAALYGRGNNSKNQQKSSKTSGGQKI